MARPMNSSVIGWMVSSIRIFKTSALARVGTPNANNAMTSSPATGKHQVRNRLDLGGRQNACIKLIDYSPPAWLQSYASAPAPNRSLAPVAAPDPPSALLPVHYCLANPAAPEPPKHPPLAATVAQFPLGNGRRRDSYSPGTSPGQGALPRRPVQASPPH